MDSPTGATTEDNTTATSANDHRPFDWVMNSVESVPSEYTDGKDCNLIVHSKIIRGVAHPPGEPDTYNGLKMTKSELLEKYHALPGMTVYDNHDMTRPIGRVLGSKIDERGALCLDVILDTKRYPYAQNVMDRVMTGNYRGMSLGCKHRYNKVSGHVYSSDIKELSLCPQGDLPMTEIYTLASGGETTGVENPFQMKWFDIEENSSTISHDKARSDPFDFLQNDSEDSRGSSGDAFAWTQALFGNNFDRTGDINQGFSSGGHDNTGSKDTSSTKPNMSTHDAGEPSSTPSLPAPMIMGPSDTDPYYRDAFGQFASPSLFQQQQQHNPTPQQPSLSSPGENGTHTHTHTHHVLWVVFFGLMVFIFFLYSLAHSASSCRKHCKFSDRRWNGESIDRTNHFHDAPCGSVYSLRWRSADDSWRTPYPLCGGRHGCALDSGSIHSRRQRAHRSTRRRNEPGDTTTTTRRRRNPSTVRTPFR